MNEAVQERAGRLLVAAGFTAILCCASAACGPLREPPRPDGGTADALQLAAPPTWTRHGSTWVYGVSAAQLTSAAEGGPESGPESGAGDLAAGGELTAADAPGAVRALLVTPRTEDEMLQRLAFSARREIANSAAALQALASEQAARDQSPVVVRALSGAAPRSPKLRLLLVADTLRADIAEQEMTTLAARFSRAVRFDEAYAPATWTLPSMAAVQVGLPPSSLRAADGALIALPEALPSGARTIAAEARQRGFATAAVVANPTLGHENGFSQGFDVYDVPRYTEAGGWDLPDASEVAAKALELLDWFADEDLFLYLHFMDAHDPYRNHENGASLAAPTSGTEVSTGALEQLRTAYRSEARHLDRQIAALLEAIEVRRSLEVLVLTADHGEELFDHGGFGHGPTVYREVSRVPLWVDGSAIRRDALRRASRTSVSLLALRSLLLEPRAWRPEQHAQAAAAPPTVETFVHGPPRFAWLGEDQWFATGRWLGQMPPAETLIESWLRQRDEGLRQRSAGERNEERASVNDGSSFMPSDRAVPWAALPDDAWLGLARQLGAAGPGQWTFARGPLAVAAIHDVFSPAVTARRAWCWGTCAAAATTSTESPVSTGDAPNEPVLLLFEADDIGAEAVLEAKPLFSHAPDAQRWRLVTPPQRLPPRGALTWREPPREALFAAGVEETMQRLRKLGYVTD